MGKVLKYKEEVTKAMELLAQHPKTIFIGQAVVYSGSVLSETLRNVPIEKKLELPVMEECQMGLSIGLSLEDYIPVSVYPRIDFLLLAINQLSNHLDVLTELTHNEFRAKVIIRTIIGSKQPFYPGIQHCRDHTKVFEALLENVRVIKLEEAQTVVPSYLEALKSDKSTLLIEIAELYND